MKPSLSLRLALHALVADGIVALYQGEFLGGRELALSGVLLVAAWLAQARGLAADRLFPGARLLVPVAALASLVDLTYLAENVLDALVRLLLFLVLYKLAVLRTVADSRTVSFLAFFMLVAASTSAFGVGFLFVFIVFAGLVSWVTLVQHVQVEYGKGDVVAGDPVSGRALMALAVVASVTVFAIAAVLFFVLPRVGLAALPFRARLGQMVTGFSERVELGSYGSILSNSGVVMRVHLSGEANPDQLPNLRWRGVVLDGFDGKVWSVRHPRRTRLVRDSAGGFDVGVLRGSGRLLRQEVFLEPIGSDVIFSAPHALRVGLSTSVVAVDDMGAVSVASPGARLRYVVESELETPVVTIARIRRPAPPLDREAEERFLQLPPLDPGIGALGRQVTGGSADPWLIAARLERFFLRDFRYTLDIERVSKLGPLEEFLFVRRSGNCEYFAAGMAVLLRTQGVPARVVNGFQRGEWNPYGQYFIVRYLDAHSWVEAYMPGAGWVTFDPTPRAGVEVVAARTPWLLYLDSVRLQWHRYVVNWSLRDQVRAVQAVHLRLAGVRGWSASLDAEARTRLARWAALGMVAAVGVAGLWVWWRGRRAPARGAGRSAPAFYRRALRAVARRGLQPARGETAREFQARVAALGPPAAAAFDRVTVLYERARFGEAPPSDVEAREIEACVEALGAGGRS